MSPSASASKSVKSSAVKPPTRRTTRSSKATLVGGLPEKGSKQSPPMSNVNESPAKECATTNSSKASSGAGRTAKSRHQPKSEPVRKAMPVKALQRKKTKPLANKSSPKRKSMSTLPKASPAKMLGTARLRRPLSTGLFSTNSKAATRDDSAATSDSGYRTSVARKGSNVSDSNPLGESGTSGAKSGRKKAKFSGSSPDVTADQGIRASVARGRGRGRGRGVAGSVVGGGRGRGGGGRGLFNPGRGSGKGKGAKSAPSLRPSFKASGEANGKGKGKGKGANGRQYADTMELRMFFDQVGGHADGVNEPMRLVIDIQPKPAGSIVGMDMVVALGDTRHDALDTQWKRPPVQNYPVGMSAPEGKYRGLNSRWATENGRVEMIRGFQSKNEWISKRDGKTNVVLRAEHSKRGGHFAMLCVTPPVEGLPVRWDAEGATIGLKSVQQSLTKHYPGSLQWVFKTKAVEAGTDEPLTFWDGYSDAWVCHLLYIRCSYTQAEVDGVWMYLDPRNPKHWRLLMEMYDADPPRFQSGQLFIPKDQSFVTRYSDFPQSKFEERMWKTSFPDDSAFQNEYFGASSTENYAHAKDTARFHNALDFEKQLLAEMNAGDGGKNTTVRTVGEPTEVEEPTEAHDSEKAADAEDTCVPTVVVCNRDATTSGAANVVFFEIVEGDCTENGAVVMTKCANKLMRKRGTEMEVRVPVPMYPDNVSDQAAVDFATSGLFISVQAALESAFQDGAAPSVAVAVSGIAGCTSPGSATCPWPALAGTHTIVEAVKDFAANGSHITSGCYTILVCGDPGLVCRESGKPFCPYLYADYHLNGPEDDEEEEEEEEEEDARMVSWQRHLPRSLPRGWI